MNLIEKARLYHREVVRTRDVSDAKPDLDADQAQAMGRGLSFTLQPSDEILKVSLQNPSTNRYEVKVKGKSRVFSQYFNLP